MQPRSTVTVVTVGDDDTPAKDLGPAVLVAPDVAVMRMGNREPAPSLPLQVLVPVAAGGGRDEHIPVVEVATATSGEPLVGLRLARPASGPAADPTTLAAALASLDTAAAQGVTSVVAGSWLCRIFRFC